MSKNNHCVTCGHYLPAGAEGHCNNCQELTLWRALPVSNVSAYPTVENRSLVMKVLYFFGLAGTVAAVVIAFYIGLSK